MTVYHGHGSEDSKQVTVNVNHLTPASQNSARIIGKTSVI